jgi:hypothetical protein
MKWDCRVPILTPVLGKIETTLSWLVPNSVHGRNAVTDRTAGWVPTSIWKRPRMRQPRRGSFHALWRCRASIQKHRRERSSAMADDSPHISDRSHHTGNECADICRLCKNAAGSEAWVSEAHALIHGSCEWRGAGLTQYPHLRCLGPCAKPRDMPGAHSSKDW